MNPLYLPTTIEAAQSALVPGAVVRAGGTDLQDRRQLGLAQGPIVDLRDVPGLDAMQPVTGGLQLGAKVTIAALADDAHIRAAYPGVALCAASLASPHIRAVATIAGNLLQAPRCWYYRSDHFRCLKSGGTGCHARTGDHSLHVVFDTEACVAPHVSTMALAMLAYDASVQVHGADDRTIAALYADRSDPAADHTLGADAIMTHVTLPPPTSGDRAGYVRSANRAYAEWPLADALVRLVIEAGTITLARVVVGGVATVPLRLPHVEEALVGQAAETRTYRAAASLATRDATPLPNTGYKLPLLEGAVLGALEIAHDRPPAPSAAPEPLPPTATEPEHDQ